MDIQLLFQFQAPSLICNHCIKQIHPDRNEDALYDEHYHQTYEILFVRSGKIFYQIGDNRFPVPANTLVFTRPGMVHSIQLEAETLYERYNFLFAPAPENLHLLQQIPDSLHLLEAEPYPLILQLFERLDYYSKVLAGEERIQILTSLLNELLLNMVIVCRSSEKSNSNEVTGPLQHILSYIDSHLLQISDIDELCASLGISKSNLHRLFTQELNSTPKRYIQERRLAMAQWEISSGNKATAIYEKYGYTDYSAFFRAYSKQFGYAPSETPQSAFTKYSNPKER